jgi:2-polyprenyl-3-methyl-5-hydroxy-6-metoxy-1,4-benzoquinol methylase
MGRPLLVTTKFQYDRKFYETDARYLANLERKEQDPVWFKDYYGAVLTHSTAESAILDCGCGTGITTAWLHQHRPHIRGVDFSSTFIETARKRGDYFEVMDLKELRYPDGHFVVVCSADAIEHVPDLPRALGEMLRVLRPGGVMVLQAPNLSTSILSTNYYVTWRNVLRKMRFLVQDLRQPPLRTIESFALDVHTGDKDAYNLISPLWLVRHLRERDCKILYVTTYALYFRPNAIARWVLRCMSVFPILRHIGGRIVLVARKVANQ